MKALAIETITANEATNTRLRVMPHPAAPKRGSFTSEAYRLHSFQVLDANGEKVGIVDWIWTDLQTGRGEFLGVNLRWLRGTTRAIPTFGAEIDHETATIQVAYTAAQIKRARRFKIDRALTVREKRRIYFSYQLEPSALHNLIPTSGVAA
ncbi:MAG TPA: PRC-barrel domain-containing protein [Chloroflexota bacterium]|jgi:hypothetical protein